MHCRRTYTPRRRRCVPAVELDVTSRVTIDALLEQVWPLALPVLEAGEHVPDLVALAIEVCVMLDRKPPTRARRNAGEKSPSRSERCEASQRRSLGPRVERRLRDWA